MFAPTTFGKYYLYERLAVGGMAEIYKAKLFGVGGFEKIMVVKQILPQLAKNQAFVEMFIDEAKIAVSLSHGNIVPVYELGKIQGTYFIAMEYVDGKNLAEILETARLAPRQLPWSLAIFLGIEICKGLDYAHRKKDPHGRPLNIIHRDISPQNVLVSFDGEVKIVDFGIAKAASKLNETESGVIKGKLSYMSPEQACGDKVDLRSDLFSVGVLLWEMATGRRLFAARTDVEVLELVTKRTPPPPSMVRADLPATFDAIVGKTLARDRDERYGDAHDLQLALAKLLFSEGPGATAQDLADFMRSLFNDELDRRVMVADDGKSVAEALAAEDGRLEIVDRLVHYDEPPGERSGANHGPTPLVGPGGTTLGIQQQRPPLRTELTAAPPQVSPQPAPQNRPVPGAPDPKGTGPVLVLTERVEDSPPGRIESTQELSRDQRKLAADEARSFTAKNATEMRLAAETDDLLADLGIGPAEPAAPAAPIVAVPASAAAPAPVPSALEIAATQARPVVVEPPRTAPSSAEPAAAHVSERPAPVPTRPPPAATIVLPRAEPAPAVAPVSAVASKDAAQLLVGSSRPAADLEDPSSWQPPATSGGGNMIWIVTIGALIALLGVVIWKTGILDRDKKDKAAAERREEKLKAWKASKIKYGNLEIRTEPDEAQVFMKIGKAPASVPKLDIGQRNWLLIEHVGYKSERVLVRPDQWKPTPGVASDAKETHRAEINVTLRPERVEPIRPPKGKGAPAKEAPEEPPAEPAGKYGVLRVNATPAGSTVWVLTGYTPSMSMTNLKLDQEYEFKVVKDHYLPETVRIAQGDWRQSGEDYAFSRLLPLQPDPNDPPEGGEAPAGKDDKAKAKAPPRKAKRR